MRRALLTALTASPFLFPPAAPQMSVVLERREVKPKIFGEAQWLDRDRRITLTLTNQRQLAVEARVRHLPHSRAALNHSTQCPCPVDLASPPTDKPWSLFSHCCRFCGRS